MISLFKAKKAVFDLSILQVDMHSHLIPGVDDGAPEVEDAIVLIRGMEELGYQKIITTPHIYKEYYPNTRKTLEEGFERLQKGLEGQQLKVDLEYAAEYFLDDHFQELLEKKELLTFADNRVLVEMSFFGAPPNLYELLFEVQTQGYKPILAHPERYTYYGKNTDKYEKLKDHGCWLQVNLLSLVGHYGPEVQKNAQNLLKAGLVDLLGTDLHNALHLEKLQAYTLDKRTVKLLENTTFKNHKLL